MDLEDGVPIVNKLDLMFKQLEQINYDNEIRVLEAKLQ